MTPAAVASLPFTLLEQLKRESIFTGGTTKTRHLAPPHNLMLEGTPLWMTRCGLEWPDGPWYQAVPFAGPDVGWEWCEACLEQAGARLLAKSDELYERAVREWVARRVTHRPTTHRWTVTADQVRNIRYGIDHGYTGSDVTPPDDPEPSIVCEVKVDGKWREVEMGTPSPVELVKQCLAIVEDLRVQPA